MQSLVLIGLGLLVGGAVYGLLAYVVLPALWRHYEHNQKLQGAPKTTQTAEGIPGDPLNVGLIGTQPEVVRALLSAGWYPADPITFGTSVAITTSVLLKRPYLKAPVSNLYLWGRKQDLAFELPVNNSVRQRNHVRLWRSQELSSDDRPLWIGAATFDRSVGLNHFTGQVTHHIKPDIDAERDTLMQDLTKARQLLRLYQVTGVGATLQGRNGGGDWYYTDGELTIGVLSVNSVVQTEPPIKLTNSAPVEVKNHLWSRLRSWLRHV